MYTHAFLIVVFVLGITAGAALADEQWTKDLESGVPRIAAPSRVRATSSD